MRRLKNNVEAEEFAFHWDKNIFYKGLVKLGRGKFSDCLDSVGQD